MSDGGLFQPHLACTLCVNSSTAVKLSDTSALWITLLPPPPPTSPTLTIEPMHACMVQMPKGIHCGTVLDTHVDQLAVFDLVPPAKVCRSDDPL